MQGVRGIKIPHARPKNIQWIHEAQVSITGRGQSNPFLAPNSLAPGVPVACLLFRGLISPQPPTQLTAQGLRLRALSWWGALPAPSLPFAWDGRVSLQCRRPRFVPWVGKIPWRREWRPTPVFLPGEFHGQRNPVGYSPWGCKESDTPHRLTLSPSLFTPCSTMAIALQLGCWACQSRRLAVFPGLDMLRQHLLVRLSLLRLWCGFVLSLWVEGSSRSPTHWLPKLPLNTCGSASPHLTWTFPQVFPFPPFSFCY